MSYGNFREKEDDLERRFELLNRELRSILQMEGMLSSNAFQKGTVLVKQKHINMR